jgi:hypothetical protein
MSANEHEMIQTKNDISEENVHMELVIFMINIEVRRKI